MPKLYVTEYAALARDTSGAILQAGEEPALADYAIEIGLESTPSSRAFSENTRFLMYLADEDCHVSFGEQPEAAVGRHKIEAGERCFSGVHPGHRIAVISAE